MKTGYPQHHRQHPRISHWQQTAAWTLQTAALIVFMTAGSAKLLGAENMVATFSDLGAGGQGLRHLVGGLEIVGATLLVFPDRAYVGSLILSILMGSAILAHLTLIDGGPIPAIALLGITVAIAWLRRPETE
ncbi:MAG: DoxX family protein [Leptolyngbya sp. SIOISBB]|nr:DoxX family protein [Leptolyngbya sp. SIOISBB]